MPLVIPPPRLSVFIIFCFPVLSDAAEVWAPGVSRESGWVDFNKENSSGIFSDMAMCWAASASNVITWWQAQNTGKLSDLTLPTETAWDVFRTVYKDIGTTPNYGYNWWINGVSDYDETKMDTDTDVETKESASWYLGGFLKDVYDTSEYAIRIASGNSNSYDFSRTIVEALRNGYALSISAYDGGSAHAYTLWGVAYDETDAGLVLTKAYITNSDDKKTALLERDIIFKATDGAHSVSFVDETVPDTALAWQYLDGMRTIAIPEPSAFGLIAATIALSCVASRRRKHR